MAKKISKSKKVARRKSKRANAKSKPKIGITRKSLAQSPSQTNVLMYDPIISSDSELLLRSILANKKSAKTTETSLLFNSVLSTLTPGMRNLYYRSGVSIGRALYKIYHSKRRYMWYEESVADLVAFFEDVGFSRISYNVFPDMIDLKFHNRNKDYLGTNMHTFEAGIICGFLTAGKQQHVRVEEVECSCNGADYCHFVTTESLPLYLEINGSEVLGNFILNTRNSVQYNRDVKKSFSEEYYALSSSVFLDPEYHDHIKKIIYYMGSQIAMKLNAKDRKTSEIQTYEQLFDILNLGKLSIKKVKPISAVIQFERLNAKKSFVEMSITFLSGLVANRIKQKSILELKQTTKKNNSYIAKINEKSIK